MVLCPPFLIKLEFGNVAFCGVGKTGVPGEKPLRAREKTNDKFNPHNYVIDTEGKFWRCVCGGRGWMGDSNHRRALINLAHKKIERGGGGVVKKTIGLVRSSYDLPK